jgi:hypothetical protein
MPFVEKVPVRSLEKTSVKDKVENILSADKKNAYTVQGIMVEHFGVKKDEICNKPFSVWKKGYPTLYSRIRSSLIKLRTERKVGSGKHGKADVFYWIETS